MAKLKSGSRVYGSFSADSLRLTKQLTSTEYGTYFNAPPMIEGVQIVSGSANASTTLNVKTSNVWLFTSASTATWTHNITGDANTTLDSIMLAGESIVVTSISRQTSTSFYTSTLNIDGGAVSINWQGGNAPTAGLSTAGYDMYTWLIIKLSGASFTVFGTLTRFG